jgi:hypothetical protein
MRGITLAYAIYILYLIGVGIFYIFPDKFIGNPYLAADIAATIGLIAASSVLGVVPVTITPSNGAAMPADRSRGMSPAVNLFWLGAMTGMSALAVIFA